MKIQDFISISIDVAKKNTLYISPTALADFSWSIIHLYEILIFDQDFVFSRTSLLRVITVLNFAHFYASVRIRAKIYTNKVFPHRNPKLATVKIFSVLVEILHSRLFPHRNPKFSAATVKILIGGMSETSCRQNVF